MKFNIFFVNFICPLSKDLYGVSVEKKFILYTQNESFVNQFQILIYDNIVNLSSNQFSVI